MKNKHTELFSLTWGSSRRQARSFSMINDAIKADNMRRQFGRRMQFGMNPRADMDSNWFQGLNFSSLGSSILGIHIRTQRSLKDNASVEHIAYNMALASSPIGGEFFTDFLIKSLEIKGLNIKPRYAFKRKEIRPREFQIWWFEDNHDKEPLLKVVVRELFVRDKKPYSTVTSLLLVQRNTD
ncbi:hypothetical protein POM88_032004 [Heracleum sosnowskyi]|uniref:Uncharacterized protein n=1 Tax=Heracleum sosnowskyi TaxID=360622 RepID=A0AAD8MJM2_9APIA|nr:hypothetical protein POM88_032004 [Heracleum sosnowskyi]